MEWFRFYHGALDDPKVQRLQPVLFKHWVNLLCLASQEGERGRLPGTDAIAFRLRLTEVEAEGVIGELTTVGLIDQELCGGLAIHNWSGRQRASDDVAERQRKRRGNVTGNDDVTLHEPLPVTTKSLSRATEQIQSRTDTEQNRAEGESSPALAPEALPLPKNLEMTDDDGAAALVAGLAAAEIAEEWKRFKNYYIARQNERRTDWHAQWRNWLGKIPQFPAKTTSNGTMPRREKSPPSSGVVSRGQGDQQKAVIGR